MTTVRMALTVYLLMSLAFGLGWACCGLLLTRGREGMR